MKHHWTDTDRATLRALYPEFSAAECAAAIGCSVSSINNQAHALGLRKSREWIAARARERTMRPGHGSRAGQFRPGLTPWNKGKKGLQLGGKHSRFRPGERPHTWRPVGHEVVREGRLWRKVTDKNRGERARFNSKPVAVLVWEAEHGQVPAGHIVRFREGMATTVASEITIDRLELVTRAENMARNTLHRYPKEVAQLIQLRGALNRKINARTKDRSP